MIGFCPAVNRSVSYTHLDVYKRQLTFNIYTCNIILTICDKMLPYQIHHFITLVGIWITVHLKLEFRSYILVAFN